MNNVLTHLDSTYKKTCKIWTV